MTESATPTIDIDKNVIDGSRVVHREMAKLATPLSKYPDGLSPTYGVDKCVLEDGRTLFQCVHPDFPECVYWHMNGISVRSHLRIHTLKNAKKEQAELKEELARLQAREAETREARARGGRIAAANRAANRVKKEESTGMTPDQLRKELATAQTAVEGVAEGASRMVTVLSNIVKSLDITAETLGELSKTDFAKVVDPDVQSKADRWDALQGLMGNNSR